MWLATGSYKRVARVLPCWVSQYGRGGVQTGLRACPKSRMAEPRAAQIRAALYTGRHAPASHATVAGAIEHLSRRP